MIPDIETIERWLEEKHCTLWSNWCVDDEKGRRSAAMWLRREMVGLHDFEVYELIKEIQPWPLPPPKEEDRRSFPPLLGVDDSFWAIKRDPTLPPPNEDDRREEFWIPLPKDPTADTYDDYVECRECGY